MLVLSIPIWQKNLGRGWSRDCAAIGLARAKVTHSNFLRDMMQNFQSLLHETSSFISLNILHAYHKTNAGRFCLCSRSVYIAEWKPKDSWKGNEFTLDPRHKRTGRQGGCSDRFSPQKANFCTIFQRWGAIILKTLTSYAYAPTCIAEIVF